MRRAHTAMWHMVPITPTWAVSYFVHAQMFFNRKCKHFYDIWLPLLRRWQFHLSCMSITSIGHVSTVHVCIWRWKDARAQPYDIWFPLLQHGQFHLSCMLIRHYIVYCTIIMYWAVYWRFLFSCMSRCSSNGNVSTVHVLYTWYMAVRAVLYRCAGLCCTAVRVACVYFHRGHQKRCFIARKCSRILQTNNKKCTWSKKVPKCFILGKATYHTGRYV